MKLPESLWPNAAIMPCLCCEHAALKETLSCAGDWMRWMSQMVGQSSTRAAQGGWSSQTHLELVRRLRGWQMTPRRMLGWRRSLWWSVYRRCAMELCRLGMMAGSDAVTEEMVEQGQVRSFGLSDQAGGADG